jgi:hypothetical protein
MSKPILSREIVRESLIYNLNTGVFTRRRNSGTAKQGDIAGAHHNAGYWQISLLNYQFLAHRLAFYYVLGCCPDEVDHINHNRCDNRWINLRPTTRIDNCRNQSITKLNTSGCVGVSRYRGTKWQSGIKVKGKRIHLGHFDDFIAAVDARKSAEVEYGFHPNHGKPENVA